MKASRSKFSAKEVEREDGAEIDRDLESIVAVVSEGIVGSCILALLMVKVDVVEPEDEGDEME
jgi:hypothetical protein